MVPLEESEGSRRGQVYLGPGKERIPNRGQKMYKGYTQGNSRMKNMLVQDAPVRKPLAAVSGITHKNNLVLFDQEGSFIAPGDAPEVKQIRRLIKQVKDRIELYEDKGVYLMPFWVRDESESKEGEGEESVFSRRGK